MTFLQSIFNFWNKAADFKSRIGRREFWYAAGFYYLLTTVPFIIIDIMSPWDAFGMFREIPPFTKTILSAYQLFYILAFVPWMALVVRRFRDINYDFTHILIPVFIGISFAEGFLYIYQWNSIWPHFWSNWFWWFNVMFTGIIAGLCMMPSAKQQIKK